MKATLEMRGAASFSSPSRLDAISSIRNDTPVALPPGRAKLAIIPSCCGSALMMKTIGIVCVALTAKGATSPPAPSHTPGLNPPHPGGRAGKPPRFALGVAIFDEKFLPFDVPEVAQAAPERRG